MTQQTPQGSNSNPAKHYCEICKAPLTPSITPWLWCCNACNFLQSDLWNEEVWARKESPLDETRRIPAIKKLRELNAQATLDLLESIQPLKGLSACDIGCGYGWFLTPAEARGVSIVGIEPEEKIATAARSDGHTIITGCFPDCLNADQRFDLITFNDVLEHIPAAERCIQACATHLKPGGLLSIAIPSSNGIFYKTATILARLGIWGPFERLWQKNFHSPHVSYFNPKTLRTLVGRNGFTLVKETSLPTLEVRGLWDRLLMDSSQSRFTAAILWLGILIASPIFSILPADIIYHVYRRTNS